jgi:uroporphyrinogen decarboxylase
MNHRENLKGLLKREKFDFYPVEFALCPRLQEIFREQTGSTLSWDEYFDFNWRGVGRIEYPGQEKTNWPSYYNQVMREGTFFDDYGVAHEPGSEAAKHMTRMHHPMKSFSRIEQFQEYPYPSPSRAKISGLKEKAGAIHERGLAALGGLWATVWEVPWYMRSMEELMMDMMDDDEKAEYHLNRCLEISCFEAAEFTRAGCDIIHLGDDVGMQTAIMISEDMYREWIKPRYKKLVEAAKAVNPDVIFSYHSCGYVRPFIQDFIDVGIDVLNPVQPECMDFKEIYEEFGDRISFWGTIGTQTTMPFGTSEEVRKCVLANLELTGDKGGLLCAPTHLLEPEVPWENVMAYVNAVREFNQAHFGHPGIRFPAE